VAWAWAKVGSEVGSAGWITALERRTEGVRELPAELQVALAVGGLLTLVASALAAERLTLPLLRLLEGYWPAPASDRLRRRFARRRRTARHRLRTLAAKREQSELTAGEQGQLSTLESRPRRIPATTELTMPTRLGNLLRTAEARPREHYGLDVVVCWPYLWPLLDETSREEVSISGS
jgi:hypothetical protein